MKITDVVQNDLEVVDGVYHLKPQRAFNYSDGDASEVYVHNVIASARDVSSSSQELEGHIKDWPSRYHLSRERSLVYRSLEIPSSASVLEVGCGCGAITRLLGEQAGDVLALEGSPRRAAITRARTRDLPNVSVLCGSFADVDFQETFDFVVCNGVLEYAPLFVRHDNPADEFMRLVTRLLKPTGYLIVAIENKLGLRYFSSGKEEHTNVMYDGLEGYARYPKGPVTFGFDELHSILATHCASVETLLPLPDYKLPSAIVRTELLDEVNCADLFADLSRNDFGTGQKPRMHERLVWHELQKNNALKLFANSYVMIASRAGKSLLRDGWMGDIYSVKRVLGRGVRTTIVRDGDGIIRTRKSGAAQAQNPSAAESADSAWISGVSIHTLVARAMLLRRPKLSLEDRLREPVLAWWNGISGLSDAGGSLAGVSLDCIWQNSILQDGRVSFIDNEWVAEERIQPSTLIYRAVAHFVARETPYLHRWSPACRRVNEVALMRAVAGVVGVPLTLSDIVAAMDRDRELLLSVHGKQSGRLKRLTRLFLPLQSFQYRQAASEGASGIKRVARMVLRRLSPRR
jgi:SAM-dependent methyltransferase